MCFGSDKYGLPTPYDDDVILALLYCYKDQNLQGRKVHFTLYRLCHIMQKTLSKREYDRIRESLNRLTSTTIAATNCFYDNAAKSWVSETFHLFDRHKLYQEQKRQGSPLPLSFFIELSEVFARSVAIANYIKDLDLKTYYSLELPISKRLFRYLDKNRYNKTRYEESLMKMARKLPLDYVYPSQVKQKLTRAHEELLRKQYLTNVLYRSTQQGEDKVIYQFAERETSGNKKLQPVLSTAGRLYLISTVLSPVGLSCRICQQPKKSPLRKNTWQPMAPSVRHRSYAIRLKQHTTPISLYNNSAGQRVFSPKRS